MDTKREEKIMEFEKDDVNELTKILLQTQSFYDSNDSKEKVDKILQEIENFKLNC